MDIWYYLAGIVMGILITMLGIYTYIRYYGSIVIELRHDHSEE